MATTDRARRSLLGATGSPPWGRALKRDVQLGLDLLALAAAFALAYLLRFDFDVPSEWRQRALVQFPVVVLLQIAVLLATGIHRFVWRYVGMAEIAAFVQAALYSGIPLLLLRLGLPDRLEAWRMPLSVILMDSALAFGGLLALRVLRRSLYERYEREQRWADAGGERRKRVLLVGAGRAGVAVMREIAGRGDTGLEVVGFVDDDPAKRGSVIHGVPVLGTTAELPRLAAARGAERVIISMTAAGAPTLRRIVALCEEAKLRVQIIPGLYEILLERVSISRFRDVEIEDLLGREPVELDEEALAAFLTGKVVMVTGAGGSIGSELARQIARFHPSCLLLVERTEGALFDADRELERLWPAARIEAQIGDVGDPHRMQAVFAAYRPQVVLHAAAHKHVPLMEDNPTEAVRNNVLATHTLAAIAARHGAEAFVLVSTDKAVRPSSMMGASKRLAELVVQDLQRRHPATRFVTVRFGNVMGSAGSVVPIFREQIRRGGPLTVTHPEATRYFMTIPEAAQLVLQAGAIGQAGEILVLDMGRPVSILELAKDMITLSGFKPFEEIAISFTGLRPGEKLVEELEAAGEELDRTRHPKILVGRPAPAPAMDCAATLARLRPLVESGDREGLRAVLAELLPEARLQPFAPVPPALDGRAAEVLLH